MKTQLRTLTILSMFLILATPLGQGSLATAPTLTQQQFCSQVSDIPRAECEALVQLYNSTDGPHWTTNAGWLVNSAACSWHGISCAAGHATEVRLDNNNLGGAIPRELGGLTNLQILSFVGDHLMGSIPPELGNLGELEVLSLGQNQLSGAIPSQLGRLTKLSVMNLQSNLLSGNIPSELGDLTSLSILYLGGNQLSGGIPGSLGALSRIQALDLHRNQLSGPIPAALANLENLEHLGLDDNQLSGAAPPELELLGKLSSLLLGGNQLSGPIPAQWAALTNLQDLALDRNQFSGMIPSQLGGLSKLYHLKLSNNQLSGPLPRSLLNLHLWEFRYDHTSLCEPGDAEFQSWLASIQWRSGTGITCQEDPTGPTILVAPATGYATSRIQVSGRGVPGSPGVRVSWLGNYLATETLGETLLDAHGNYSLNIEVPANASLGTHRIFVATTGSSSRRSSWVDFVVTPMPPGALEGRTFDSVGLPVAGAHVRALNLASDEVFTVDTGPMGWFEFESLPPADYAVSAWRPGYWFPGSEVSVRPLQTTTLDLQADPSHLNPLQGCVAEQWIEFRDGYDAPDPPPVHHEGRGDDNPIGTYVSLPGKGVPVVLTFRAAGLEYGSRVDPRNVTVQYLFESADGSERYAILESQDYANDWPVQYDMSNLPAGRIRLRKVAFDRTDVTCATTSKIIGFTMLPNRWLNGNFANAHVEWQNNGCYDFYGTLPANPPFDLNRPRVGPWGNDMTTAYQIRVGVTETFCSGGYWYAIWAELDGRTKVAGVDVPVWECSYCSHGAYPLAVDYDADHPYGVPRYDFMLPWQTVVYGQGGVSVPLFNIYIVDIGFSINWGKAVTVRITGDVRGDLYGYLAVRPWVTDQLALSVYGDILWGVAGVSTGVKTEFVNNVDAIYGLGGFGPGELKSDICHAVRLWANVKAKILWGILGWTIWEGVVADWVNPEGCLHQDLVASLPQSATDESALPMPAVAADSTGHALSLWVQDLDPDLAKANPEVVYSRLNNGVWSLPLPLTHNENFETDPQVAFLPNGHAAAVWTQNKLLRGDVDTSTTLDEALNGQELYAAIWDGAGWSTPTAITSDALADGRASLAADPATGRALVAWVKDLDGRNETRGDWEIYTAWWNGLNWSAPAPLSNGPGIADLQPSVAFGPVGRAIVAWTRDHDLTPGTNDDRRLAYTVWDGTRWGPVAEPPELPVGAFQPSVALADSGDPLIAFLVRGNDPVGKPYGMGHHDYLWSARLKAGTWDVSPVGGAIVAERPQLRVSGSRAAIAFRQTGAPGNVYYQGDVALVTADLSRTPLRWGAPRYLTADEGVNWQVGFAWQPDTSGAFIVSVKEPTPASSATDVRFSGGETSLALPASTQSATLATTDDGSQIILTHLSDGSDLTLTPADLAVSQTHPQPGEIVAITATVRNLGTAPVTVPFVVRFVLDPGGSAVELAQKAVSDRLGFNDSMSVTAQWQAEGGIHSVAVDVDALNAVVELDEANNHVGTILGRPAPPASLSLLSDERGLHLLWSPSPSTGLAEYNIYRSETIGGPYEFVGLAQSPGTRYDDLLLVHGKKYYYIVTAVDGYGAESSPTTEVAGVWQWPDRIFLPLVRTR